MIKNLALTAVLVCITGWAHSQILVKPLTNVKGKVGFRTEEAPDTVLTLPFWDDFSTVETRPSPLFWKYGENVRISSTIGVNPPTYNVAVLNGVDSLGIPYDVDDSQIIPVDSLVSQQIDMTRVPVNLRSTVYMSFFWQANGLGEIPDADDFLSLSFLSAEGEWISQDINPESDRNELRGGPDVLRFSPGNPDEQIFTEVILQVTPEFLHENFRFKFQSFGSSQGDFDSWLIDYIYINYNRNITDNTYDDRAISQGPQIYFGGYSAIPYDHFFNNPALEPQTISFEINSFENRRQPIKYFVEILDSARSEILSTIDDNVDLASTVIRNSRQVATSSPISPEDILTEEDSITIVLKTYIDSNDDDSIPNATNGLTFRANDTIYTELTLERSYAYDDGSAEFSAGINVDGGKLVVKYGIITEDTLTAIDINFPVLFPNSERERIRILVLSDLNDNPESTLIRQSAVVPRRNSSEEFTRFELREQLILKDTIYIGIEQFNSTYIPIGLDKNTDNSDKIFFNLGEEWEDNNAVDGSLMIRPVFGPPFAPASNEIDQFDEITIYPNPTTGSLNISGKYDHISVMDLSGKSVDFFKTTRGKIEVGHLESGIYLIRFERNGVFFTKRFIKK